MSILIDEKTMLIIQGITGREGNYHALLMKNYGTNIVGGVSPGKGRQDVDGIPVFNSVQDVMINTDANTSILFVPPQFTKDAILEAIDSDMKLVVAVAEGVPVRDMVFCYSYARKNNCILIGPNTPGVISPGKSKVGFMADTIYRQGNVGIISRSATLSYESANDLSMNGIGQSTVVGIGGDPICGSTFIDLLPLFEEDQQTEVVIMIGEIGGADEEMAANYIKNNVSKPVIAFIAGDAAPTGKRMGHAGAIISQDGEGSADQKKRILREAGIHIAEKLTGIPDRGAKILKEKGEIGDENIA